MHSWDLLGRINLLEQWVAYMAGEIENLKSAWADMEVTVAQIVQDHQTLVDKLAAAQAAGDMTAINEVIDGIKAAQARLQALQMP